MTVAQKSPKRTSALPPPSGTRLAHSTAKHLSAILDGTEKRTRKLYSEVADLSANIDIEDSFNAVSVQSLLEIARNFELDVEEMRRELTNVEEAS